MKKTIFCTSIKWNNRRLLDLVWEFCILFLLLLFLLLLFLLLLFLFFPLILLIVFIYYQEQSLSLFLTHLSFIPLFPFFLSFTVCFTPRFLFFYLVHSLFLSFVFIFLKILDVLFFCSLSLSLYLPLPVFLSRSFYFSLYVIFFVSLTFPRAFSLFFSLIILHTVNFGSFLSHLSSTYT